MGYFSNYALDYEADYEDNSYPSPEKQLMWRLEDLQSRWEELKEYSAPHSKYDAGLRLSDDDVRYAIPEYFTSVRDVERAIKLAISDLRANYGIGFKENSTEEEQFAYDLPIVGQLTLDEIEFATSYDEPLNAA